MLSLGLDIGTTSICGVLLDTDTGKLVKKLTLPNNSAVESGYEWQKQQNTEMILQTVREIIGRLGVGSDMTASIGVTGQMHGIVYIDKNGRPLGDLTTWQDGRGNLIYKDGMSYAEYMSRMSGFRLSTGYGSVTLFYDTVNGSVPENAAGICTVHDLIVAELTQTRPVTHASDAASLGFYNPTAKRFETEKIKALGMSPELFPDVVDDYFVCGKYRNIPVTTAIGDNQASVLGSVADPEASLLVNVGTGSQISCIVPNYIDSPTVDCRPFFDGKYIIAGSSLCGGRAYAILKNLFADIVKNVTGRECDDIYSAMTRTVGDEFEKSPLCIDTSFGGTRSSPEKRGVIRSIGVDNFNMKNLCAGVMDGIVDELNTMYRDMLPLLDGERTTLVGSGNGIRLNKSLCNRFERDFHIKICIPAHTEEAAYGAALHGGAGAGIIDGIDSARKLIKYTEAM